MKTSKSWVSTGVIIGLLAGTTHAVNIDTVPVGNPGNVADTHGTPGYGSVGYTYNIGKYEVTAGQYCEFLNKVAATDTYGLYNTYMWSTTYGCKIQQSGTSGSYTYSVASDYANRPVNYVSYWDACRFANWLHNGQPAGPQGTATTETGAYTLNGYNYSGGRTIPRNADWTWAITSEDEWYKAAYYQGGSTDADYYDFPTSSNTVPGRDLDDESGNNANYYGDPWPIQSPYYATLAGEFQNSTSPYGTFDQGGNAKEWTETIREGIYRGVRGGSFRTSYQSLLASYRIYEGEMAQWDDIGFRVVAVPEPATLSLLALAGIGLFTRKHSRAL